MAKENIIFCGARGSGKTFAAIALAKRRDCVVFIDPTSTVTDFDYVSTDPKQIAEVVRRYPTFQAALWTGHMTQEQSNEALSIISDSAEKKEKWVTLIIDEVAVIAPSLKDTARIERTSRMGRHHKVSVWLCSQRAVDITQNMRAQSEKMLIFRTGSARDVENIKKDYGKPAAEALSGLERYHYVIIDTQSGKWSERMPIPSKRVN